MNDTKYVGYFFGNMYLSSIQQGIQAAHVIQDMVPKYRDSDPFYQWCQYDKTMILLNGGYASNLAKIYTELKQHADFLNLPVGKFHEEQCALNNALTSVGIVLPSDFRMLAYRSREGSRYESITEIIEQYKLAS